MNAQYIEAYGYFILLLGFLIKWGFSYFKRGDNEKQLFDKLDEMKNELVKITDFLKKDIDLVKERMSFVERRQESVEKEFNETRAYYHGMFEKQSTRGIEGETDPPRNRPTKPPIDENGG